MARRAGNTRQCGKPTNHRGNPSAAGSSLDRVSRGLPGMHLGEMLDGHTGQSHGGLPIRMPERTPANLEERPLARNPVHSQRAY